MAEARDLGMAMLIAVVEQMGDCLEHPHMVVGRCVYCVACNRRLYQGRLFTKSDMKGLREFRELMKEEEEAKAEGRTEDE